MTADDDVPAYTFADDTLVARLGITIIVARTDAR